MNKYLEWFVYHKRQILVIGGIIVSVLMILGLGLWMFYYQSTLKGANTEEIILTDSDTINREQTTVEEETEDINTDAKLENLVTIDIKGAVNSPGVYQILDTSRISDVLNKAGGVRNDADLSVINLSKKVFDEMVIIIYTKDEVSNFVEIKKQEEEKREKCVIIEEKIVNDACVCDEDIGDENTTNNEEAKVEESIETTMVSLNQATKEQLMTLSGIGESKALLIIEYRETNDGFKNIDEIKNIKGIGDSIFEKIKDRLTL